MFASYLRSLRKDSDLEVDLEGWTAELVVGGDLVHYVIIILYP